METDRTRLSEEYDLLRATGGTDACYGFRQTGTPHLYEEFLVGWSC